MEQLLNYIRECGPKRVQIWCGAGISADAPCGLPLGYGLSQHIFEEYTLYHEPIQKVWRGCNEIIKKYIETHEFIRPEVMVSCITRMDKLTATTEFYDKFALLRSVKPNRNHKLLAAFVNFGGIVYTTNFDTCIEKAYEELYCEKMEKSLVHTAKIVRFSAQSGGSIIHLHGIFESGESAGASIEKVMSGYESEALQFINDAFAEKINLFLGYSFSDDYDLNSLYRRYCNHGGGIYVCNHKGADTSLPAKVKDICGTESSIFDCDTTILLERIISSLGLLLYDKADDLKVSNVSWKSILILSSNFCSDYKLLYTIELINQMHISFKAIDKGILDQLLKINGIIREELGNYRELLFYNMFVNSTCISKKVNKFLHNKTLKQAFHNRLNNNFFNLKSKVNQPQFKDGLLVIYRKLQEGKTLTNEDHETIAASMRTYTVSYLLGGTIEDQAILKQVNDVMCSLDYSQGEELYMFASRLRYRYLLGQNEGDWREAIKIYYDSGNLGGVISSLIARAVVESRKSGKLIFLQEEWGDVLAMIRITHHINYMIKCVYIAFSDVIGHIPLVGTWICKLILKYQ